LANILANILWQELSCEIASSSSTNTTNFNINKIAIGKKHPRKLPTLNNSAYCQVFSVAIPCKALKVTLFLDNRIFSKNKIKK